MNEQAATGIPNLPQLDPQHIQQRKQRNDNAAVQSETNQGLPMSLDGQNTQLTEETLLPLVIKQLRAAYPGYDPQSPQYLALALQQTRLMLQELYHHKLTSSMGSLSVDYAPTLSTQSATATSGHQRHSAAMQELLPQTTTSCDLQSLNMQHPILSQSASASHAQQNLSIVWNESQPPVTTSQSQKSLLMKDKHASASDNLTRLNLAPHSDSVLPASGNSDSQFKTGYLDKQFPQNPAHRSTMYTTGNKDDLAMSAVKFPATNVSGSNTVLPSHPRADAEMENEKATPVFNVPGKKKRNKGNTAPIAPTHNLQTEEKQTSRDRSIKDSRNKQNTQLSTTHWNDDFRLPPGQHSAKNESMNSVKNSDVYCPLDSLAGQEDWEEEISPYPRNIVGYSRPSDTLLMSCDIPKAKPEQSAVDMSILYVTAAASKSSAQSTKKAVRCLKSGQDQSQATPCEQAKAKTSTLQGDSEEQPPKWPKVKKRGKAGKKQKS